MSGTLNFGYPTGQTNPYDPSQYAFGMPVAPAAPPVQAPVIPTIPTPAVTGAAGGGVATTPNQSQQPAAPAQGWFGKVGGFEGMSNMLEGLGSLGQIWTSMRGLRLAEKQMKFTQDAYETNMANQRQSYNTSLEDRIRSRYSAEGRSASAADAYLQKHQL